MLTYPVNSSKISYQQEFEIALLNLVMSDLLYLLAKFLYCTEQHIWVIFSLPVLPEFDSCKIIVKKSLMNTSVKRIGI